MELSHLNNIVISISHTLLSSYDEITAFIKISALSTGSQRFRAPQFIFSFGIAFYSQWRRLLHCGMESCVGLRVKKKMNRKFLKGLISPICKFCHHLFTLMFYTQILLFPFSSFMHDGFKGCQATCPCWHLTTVASVGIVQLWCQLHCKKKVRKKI